MKERLYGICGIFFGAAVYLIVMQILWRIGPQPGGLRQILSSPEHFGFSPSVEPIFATILTLLIFGCVLGGAYLGQIYYLHRHKADKRAKKDASKPYILFAIVSLVWLAVLTVFHLFGFNIGETAAQIGLVISVLGAVVIYLLISRLKRYRDKAIRSH